ncbi:MAG: MarR family transcriptional regulator [Chloroflexota bacterium]|nr:MarR family transcriptional regulator [Chloroflexota bacterium]
MSSEDEFLNTLREWIETSTHRSMHAFIRHNRESELSLSQVNTLFRLYHHGSSPVNDLADHLGITMAAVSQLLNQLIDSGYIHRSTSTTDRRVKLITITDKGALTVERSMQARQAWINELALLFTPLEKKQILPYLELLKDRTQELMHKIDPKCGDKIGNAVNDEKY